MNKVSVIMLATVVLVFGLGPSGAQDASGVQVVEPAAGAGQFIRIEARNDRRRVIDPATLPSRPNVSVRPQTGRRPQRTIRLVTAKRAGTRVRFQLAPPGVEAWRNQQRSGRGAQLRPLYELRSGQ